MPIMNIQLYILIYARFLLLFYKPGKELFDITLKNEPQYRPLWDSYNE